jgi:hypothetical protein
VGDLFNISYDVLLYDWDRMSKLADDWLPAPRILHPLARSAFRRQTPKSASRML